MKAVCYLVVGMMYAVGGIVGHDVLDRALAVLYGGIAYTEWSHARKFVSKPEIRRSVELKRLPQGSRFDKG